MKKKAKAKAGQLPPAERGKQGRLIEDSAILDLEDAAKEYANTRDDRMALLETEVELLELMKKNKKEVYKRDGIEIRIAHEKETVKVKVKKDDE